AAHRVAGVEPAVAPRLRGRLFVLQIAGEETVARFAAFLAHQQFAARFDLHFQVFLLETKTAGADVARLAARRDQRAAAGLGHRTGLDQREAEALLEGSM